MGNEPKNTAEYVNFSNIYKREYINFRFRPKEDITTFELAKCIPFILNPTQSIMDVDFKETFIRHFELEHITL